jgi:hypothetical protein
MYVDGNLVKYTDPSGHYNAKNFMQDAVTYLTFQAIGNSNSLTEKFMLYKAGVKERYNHRNEKGSSFWRSDVGGFFKTFSLLNWVGYSYAALNYTVGRILAPITKKNPQIKKVKGGYVVTNGPLVASGISLGQFAVINDDNEATIRHEAAHIEQYNEWGESVYLGRTASGPFKNLFGGKTNWAENNADNRAGTWSYSSGTVDNLIDITSAITVLAIFKRNASPQGEQRSQAQAIVDQSFRDLGLALFLEGLGYVP